jgi:hypothetical protein
MKAVVKDAHRPGAARESLLARYPVTFYFLIAYAFAWLVWVPLADEK